MTAPDDARARARIRGLYGLADATAAQGDPVRLAADWLAGGCRLLQLRAKDWPEDAVLAAAREIMVHCEAAGADLIVNDHPWIAAEVGALGVHLGQDDAPTVTARRALRPGQLLGRSTHAPDQLDLAALDADYLAFGPVYPTQSAGRDKGVRGLEAVRAARARLPAPIPLVAIGGLDAERILAVRAAGADAWAVIGAVAHAPDRVAAVRELLAATSSA